MKSQLFVFLIDFSLKLEISVLEFIMYLCCQGVVALTPQTHPAKTFPPDKRTRVTPPSEMGLKFQHFWCFRI